MMVVPTLVFVFLLLLVLSGGKAHYRNANSFCPGKDLAFLRKVSETDKVDSLYDCLEGIHSLWINIFI
jgi:hypothetical protein